MFLIKARNNCTLCERKVVVKALQLPRPLQACLGAKAKEGERNVVQLTAEDEEGQDVTHTILSMRVGGAEQVGGADHVGRAEQVGGAEQVGRAEQVGGAKQVVGVKQVAIRLINLVVHSLASLEASCVVNAVSYRIFATQ